ncbi:LytR C-terminal domain-containing protein [Thermoleophilia bacterium SCSIO 60948]|nr:LytR C-terminal domain-containing protein [Thermoleophilia bacterium SCSIO 60948]
MGGDLSGIVDLVGGVISLLAVVSLLLVIGLYLSQRRDLQRLRAWMESDPGHPSRDLLASEAILDRAEAELSALEGPSTEPGTISPTTARIPGDRPTLSRITLEREALKPHPRWRRFVGRATQTRVLIALGVVAVVLGVLAILASEKLLEFGGDDAPATGPPEAGEITVAVLNGTPTAGAAGAVSDQVAGKGFDVGRIDTAPPGESADETQVLFVDDARPEAQRVARALKIEAPVEQASEEEAQKGRRASVIVLVGDDRAGL